MSINRQIEKQIDQGGSLAARAVRVCSWLAAYASLPHGDQEAIRALTRTIDRQDEADALRRRQRLRMEVDMESAIRLMVRSSDPVVQDEGRDLSERYGIEIDAPNESDEIAADDARDRAQDMRAEARVLEGVL